jgi:hypothetical protein
MCGMAIAESSNVIFKRAFVLEVGTTSAVPQLSAVLLVGPPVTSNSKCLTTFSTHEWLDSVLPLVMRLQGAEVLQWFGPRVFDIVAASLRTTVAGKAKHCCRLCASQRFRSFSVLRSMAPHVHLQVRHPVASFSQTDLSNHTNVNCHRPQCEGIALILKANRIKQRALIEYEPADYCNG